MASRDLPRYDEFLVAVENLRGTSNSLREFSEQLKSVTLKQLRNNARRELQSIYGEVSRDLGLPHIPVYLPVRKKVSVRGMEFSVNSRPIEIRVYPIEGVAGTDYSDWQPQDLIICSKNKYFEIFKHEIAHVIADHRGGDPEDHGEAFVAAYDELNEYFRSRGFAFLIDPSFELWGVPPGSHAAKVAASRGAAWIRTQPATGSGCLISAMKSILLAGVIILGGMILFSLVTSVAAQTTGHQAFGAPTIGFERVTTDVHSAQNTSTSLSMKLGRLSFSPHLLAGKLITAVVHKRPCVMQANTVS